MNYYERQLNKSDCNGFVDEYEELIKPHRNRIYTLMLTECGNEFQACQLTQEVFVKVFEFRLLHTSKNSLICDIYRTADRVMRQNSGISDKNALAASL